MASLVDKIKKELGFGGVSRTKRLEQQLEDADTGISEAERVRRLKALQDAQAGITRRD
jgi:hypothetical protein